VHDRRTSRSTGDADALRSPTVVVDGVAVTYRTRISGTRSLKRSLVGGHREESIQQVQALKGVSFTVHEGESVGLVGDNGSGKTTLLRTIAGLLRVTDGEVRVRSMPVLLGVAAALEPELSGRRNVFLGATALGMSRADIEALFDDIVGFSGIGPAIERPLRTYSSGMMARLRFAIATATTPDILLIDEALAVGDLSFKQRSQERMRELLERASTIFLVSHNLTEVEHVCQRVVWLEDGIVRKDGPTGAVLDAYRSSGS
jgi:teichoic acid transport system ATP-binding protein